MRVGWLYDEGNADGTKGGAEYTQREFRDCAPAGVEVVDCPASLGVALPDVDCFVVHNCVGYSREVIPALANKPVVRYIHDAWPHGDPVLRTWLLEHAQLVFTSPLHEQRFPWGWADDSKLCPPALELAAFTLARREKREGTVWLGHFMNAGKGVHRAVEWAEHANCGIDFYGEGPYAPTESGHVTVKGPVRYDDVPSVLGRYERFVMLPDVVEPFGRGVVEAWAAGCDLIVNGLVGAAWWIQSDPEALECAGERFWRIVEGACA